MFKFLQNKKTRSDFLTYALVILAFIVVSFLKDAGMIPRMIAGQLVPICAYIVMAISLNLVVGVAGDLSLGHAGFMSVGAYSGIVAAMSLSEAIPNDTVRLVIALVVGAACAALAGFLIGIPVLRLSGDYLAIVTLAFGEIIKEVVTCLIVGVDERGLHVLFNLTGKLTVDNLGLSETGVAIIKGAQGASGTDMISTLFAGFVLVMVALVIVLNLVRSRTGRAILAVRDNRIAAESVGISTTKYRMIAFVVSAASQVPRVRCSATASHSCPPPSSISTCPFSFWSSSSWVDWATCAARSSPRRSSPSCPKRCVSSPTTACSSTPSC